MDAGENICFEVIANTVKWMRSGGGQRIFRARFSAISKSDIMAAMVNLLLHIGMQGHMI